jgi:hypothetical protein
MGQTMGVTRFFKCSNGHIYGIGDCGQPRETGKCISCGVAIGAGRANYQFADGQNAQQVPILQLSDETKLGHVLDTARPNSRCLRERDMDSLRVAITRFLLHSSMLAGSCYENAEAAVNDNIYPRLQPGGVVPFLMNHLRLNLEQIAAVLNRNEDEAGILLHQIIHRMSTTPKLLVRDDTASWMGKSLRAKWETEFARVFLDPEIERLPQKVRQLKEIVSEDQSAADDALTVILNERCDGEEQEEKANATGLLIDDPRFWMPRQRVNVASLTHKVGEKRLAALCPVLTRFQREQVLLTEVQHLPDILKLQLFLVKKFSKRLESTEVSRQLALLEFISFLSFFVNRVYTICLRTIYNLHFS